MIVLGIISIMASLCILYLKYRVVLTGKKYKAKIIGLVNTNSRYTVGGSLVKKYIVKIKNKKYYTAHGCLITKLGRKKVGKDIIVIMNEKYQNEVFKILDFRIEFISLLLFLIAIICFL